MSPLFRKRIGRHFDTKLETRRHYCLLMALHCSSTVQKKINVKRSNKISRNFKMAVTHEALC